VEIVVVVRIVSADFGLDGRRLIHTGAIVFAHTDNVNFAVETTFVAHQVLDDAVSEGKKVKYLDLCK
jgi:hypothetical protein